MGKKSGTLYRGNLRDLIVVASLISAFFFQINLTQIIIALCFLALGTVLHVITKATLVRNRVLCEEGVYKICRHPYYLSNFIVDISLCLLSGNVYLVFVYPFLFFWAYGPALKFEENKLSGIYGEKYHEFLLRSAQILPCSESVVGLGRVFQETSASRISRKEWVRILRFWAVSLLLLCVHGIGVVGIKSVYGSQIDVKIVAAGVAGIFMLVAALILQMLPKKKLNGQESAEST
jgi:hypothetical protein